MYMGKKGIRETRGHLSSAGKRCWWLGLGVAGVMPKSGQIFKMHFHLSLFGILLMVWTREGKDGDG